MALSPKIKKQILKEYPNITDEDFCSVEKILVQSVKVEQTQTLVPKNFLIRCPKCCWARTSTGCKDDLKDLTEIPPSSIVHGKRKFRCPKCGGTAVLNRLYGNAPIAKE